MLKRLLPSVLICSSMMLGIAGVNASADNSAGYNAPGRYMYDIRELEPGTTKYIENYEPDPDKDAVYVSAGSIVRPFSLFTANTYNFYNILTSDEKLIYDILQNAFKEDHTKTTIMVEGYMDWDKFPRALSAFISDYPEYFWIFGYDLVGNDDYTEISIRLCDGQTENTIGKNYDTFTRKVKEITGNAGKYSTDYDKLRYFAEYICDHVVFDKAAANSNQGPNSWNAYGALINGKGVCEAYAESFKVLCDEAGIPCTLIYSYDHEWNAVKLDGKWYYIDTTWMDSGYDSVYYDWWFAVGTNTALAKDSDNLHVPVEGALFREYSKFTYPDISATDYEKTSGSGSGSGSDSDSTGAAPPGIDSDLVSSDAPGKNIRSAGATSYSIMASVASPTINVSLPASISVIINPYGVEVETDNVNYGSEGVISPVYTIRNMTGASAVKVNAEAYITVSQDSADGSAITVCSSPDEVNYNDGKAIAAYILSSVSEDSVEDEDSESESLIEENNVTFKSENTLVFADAAVEKDSNSTTIMTIPKADYDGDTLTSYHYGQFKISGEVNDSSDEIWSSSDNVNFVIVLNIFPCEG